MAKVRMEDVARYVGVSMKTVSNVIHNYPHVSPATRERVQRGIDELGYRPSALGRRLATGRTGMLALAFTDLNIPYFAELARTFSHAARDRGYRVLLEQTGGTPEGERALFTVGETSIVDGLIFQPAVLDRSDVARHRPDVPMVLLGEGHAPIGFDHVMIDNMAAAREITDHLVSLGCRRIGFVGHEMSGLSATSRVRLDGFQEGLEAAGLPLDTSRLVATDSINAEAASKAVGAALDAGLDVDGLMCRDDLAALGTLRALEERGIAVPDQVAVTGWDDTVFAGLLHPNLTTVRADGDALAATALDMLTERIQGFDGAGRHLIVGHRIIVRESAPAAR